MGNFGEDWPLSTPSLLCTEDGPLLSDDEQDREEPPRLLFYDSALQETEDEYVKTLISREQRLVMEGPPNDKWLQSDRSEAVQLILQTGKSLGFEVETLYLAVTYLDWCLMRDLFIHQSRRSLLTTMLSFACLSLAAKMQDGRVPLQVYRDEKYPIANRDILRMELRVLDEFEWRMHCILPFSYLHFFASKFSDKPDEKASIMSRATELILAIMEVICVVNYCPSAIAAAAVLVALDQELTKELMDVKIKEMSSSGSLKDEHVFSCYNQMRELVKRELKMEKTEHLPDSQSTSTSSSDALGDDSFTSLGSNSRRLTAKNSSSCDFHQFNDE